MDRCVKRGSWHHVIVLAHAVFLLCSLPGCTGSKNDIKFEILNPGQRLKVPCDQAPFIGVTLLGLDLWHMTPSGKPQHIASLTGGKVRVHQPGLDPKNVYGMQIGPLINMLTLDIPHARSDQLGGYMCTVRYRTKRSNQDITAVGGYISFFPSLN